VAIVDHLPRGNVLLDRYPCHRNTIPCRGHSYAGSL
jgi:hypothetical protein